MLLNIPLCAGQPPAGKSCLARSANSAEAEKREQTQEQREPGFLE